MMKNKGFGKPTKESKNSDYTSIRKQLLSIVEIRRQGQSTTVGHIFGTSPRRKNTLSRVVNDLASEAKDCHFSMWLPEEDLPSVVITSLEKNQKHGSYTWVEKSDRTGKYLVMASPPGAWNYLCICAWEEQAKAEEIANQIFNDILAMPLIDWNKRTGKFRKLLHSLPDDDDGVLGLIEPETGKVISFDTETRNHLQPIWKQTLNGDTDARESLLASMRQLRLEGE